MSWLRIEGRMPNHAKVSPLTDAAFRLHVTGMAWCVEEKSDGEIPKKIPSTLPAAPRGKSLERVLIELVDAELWERTNNGFIIHDFLHYNPTAAQSEAIRAAKAAAGAAGGRAKANLHPSKGLADARVSAKHAPSTSLSDAKHLAKQNPSSRAGARSASDSDSEREEDPSPPSQNQIGGTGPRDPMGDSLRGRRTQDNPEVVAVFERWKVVHGAAGSKFRQPADMRADILFEAVQTHGVSACLRVLDVSKTDRKVLGHSDEHGEEHRSIEYLFKPTTFDRLLRTAELQDKQSKKPSSDDVFDAMMAANPEP